ncbi:hypothetical protein ILUMI_03739, partial [Ignelater luminosus]
MNLFLISIALLLILGSVASAIRNDSVLNPNFYQNDYHIIPHRMELIRYSKKFLINAKVQTFKYNRTQPAVNFTGSFNFVSEDVKIIVQAYKFMSNEFRIFPLRFAVNACKAFNANAMGVLSAIKCGNFTGCPFEK